MKKLSFIILASFALLNYCFAQPCLTEGIVFSTQEEIDDFPVSFPNCTEIEGDVTISGVDINDLTPLSAITQIRGNLIIYNNNSLEVMTGLNNISHVNGNVHIGYFDIGSGTGGGNPLLTNLEGLNSIQSIGGELELFANPFLESFEGLDELDSIGIMCDICCNESITSLVGFEDLDFIGGWLTLDHNNNLMNLQGLDNLTVVQVGLSISSNEKLESLDGIESLTSTGIGGIFINDNPILEDIDGLKNINGNIGSIDIEYNDSLSVISCFNNVDTIASLMIEVNKSLESITGFNDVSSITESLVIYTNGKLKTVSGFSSLENIGGNLMIFGNSTLPDLSGLEKVSSVGGNLDITENNMLTTLGSLSNLNKVYGRLLLTGNNQLENLHGLDSLNTSLIEQIIIKNNSSLSLCSVKSVCDYLEQVSSEIEIFNNYEGCNTIEEVEDACAASNVANNFSGMKINIYPNPTCDYIFVSGNGNFTDYQISVYNQFGQNVIDNAAINESINISSLSEGLYIVEVLAKSWSERVRFIKRCTD